MANSEKAEDSSAPLRSNFSLICDSCLTVDKSTHCVTEEYTAQEPVNNTLALSGKLEIDSEIKLSRKHFEQSIKALVQNTGGSNVDKVLSAPAYPKPGILAQFAKKPYTAKQVKYDREYEQQLDLPSGWKLLTTASNTALRNGYFGAAFWHPEYHQVVISHRGTDPTSIGALYTDFKGVVYNEYASQMNTATTFALIISNVLDKINRELGVQFQLFFTGHSLGGWLAQITTFTTKYLKRVGATFQICLRTEEGYHGHATVFDSPGCKETLLQMQKDFGILDDDQTAFLDSLDISSYLSAPNRINTCNSHAGTIYRLFINLSHMSKLEEVTPLYNIITHSIDNIVEVFDPETGKILKDELGNFRVQQVLDWPLSTGLDGGEEYILFFKWAKSVNNYHPKEEDGATIQNDNYETKRYLDRTCNMSIFTRSEIQFLERYLLLRKLPDFLPENLFALIENEKAIRIICYALKTFRIENNFFRCGQAQEMEKCIPLVKYLLRFFPDIQCRVLKALSSFEIMKTIFKSASEHHISLLKEVIDLQVDREWETSVIEGFLGNSNEQICCLTFDMERNSGISLGNIYKAFISNDSSYHIDHLALRLDWILHQEQHMCMSSFLGSEQITNLLLMIDCEQVSDTKCQDAGKAFLERLFKIMSTKPEIKVFFFATRNDRTVDLIMDAGNKYPMVNYRTVRREGKMLVWNDLGVDSKQNLLRKKVITFQGGHGKMSLSELLKMEDVNNVAEIKFDDIVDPHTLAKLVYNTELMVGAVIPSFGDNYYIERSFHRNRLLVSEDILRDDSVNDVFALFNVEEVDISNITTLGNGSKNVVQFMDPVTFEANLEFKIVLLENEAVDAGFEYLRNNVKEYPIHLLTRESDTFVCHKSYGPMYSIIKYKVGSEQGSEVYDEIGLIRERCSKLVLISGERRMGKSAVLTQISTKIKEALPSMWVVKINLQDNFQKVVTEDVDFDNLIIDKAVDLLWKMIGAEDCLLDEKLFKTCFRIPSSMVILFDSMTEICQLHQGKAIQLTKVLMNSESVEQIWVTSSENLKETLEMDFGTVAYSLIPFSEGDQIKFFNDFWKCKLNLDEVDKGRLDILTETLLHLVPNSIQEPTQDLTRIVLHIKMLAEIFASEFKTSSTFESIPDVPDKLNLLELYKTFVSKKFHSYFSKISCDGDAVKIQLQKDAKEVLYKSFTVNQEYSALYTLFEESPIYKFFEANGMLTLFPSTKEAKD